jgi:N-acetylglutamate synthase-like GNAT family acetyltransferase
MADVQFHILKPNDEPLFQLIANWYFSEWNIPIEKTIQRLETITTDHSQFQIVLTLDSVPISTGGLYNHVGLIDKEPRFNVYKNWLALVYTIPNKRHQGYGAILCEHLQNHSKNLGLDAIYLFTDTAEQLYKRLGWTEMERLNIGERNMVVMKKDLLNDDEY